MSHHTPRKPRKPLLVNLVWSTALVVVLAVVYVFSYAPVYRWRYGASPGRPADGWRVSFFIPSSGRFWQPQPLYRPVDLLIDFTPLREPLFRWAELFGVRDDFEGEYTLRTAMRQLKAQGYDVDLP